MNNLIHLATAELATFLAAALPKLSDDWWNKQVVDRLSFQQQRMVIERNLSGLDSLDFAALLRTLDQNWFELSQDLKLPREGRNWLKELQTVRNKWAHLSAQTIDASEVYRDADTLGLFLTMVNASESTIKAVEAAKAEALTNMAAEQGIAPGQNGDSDVAPGTEGRVHDEPHLTKVPSGGESNFRVGELVELRSDSSVVVVIIEVLTGGSECRYVVFQNNKKMTYYESQLRSCNEVQPLRPMLNIAGLHAYLTSLQLLSPSTANLYSLRSGRIKFVPYQYRPVLKMIRADRPRLLIADEVGVGKTIEAGLIIKELRARMDISSVLIICPKALVAERKWFVEMKRFDENFTALDGSLLRHCLQETHLDGDWPDQYSKAIVPFSLFDSKLLFGKEGKGRRNTEGLLALDSPPKFDLVIVDEAHHIRNADTYLHQAVRYFCDSAQAAIFLTATPVQMGSEDLFTLLNVLRPDLVIDHASFQQMAEPNKPINQAVQSCRSAKPNWQKEAQAFLNKAAETSWGRLFLRESPGFQRVYDELGEPSLCDAGRVGVIRALEELYTFSSMINRTRRRDIGEFTTRKPETVTVSFTAEQRDLHDELLSVIARIFAHSHGSQNVKFMMTTVRRQAASCIYGLAPLLRDTLTGKLDSLELMEAGDSDIEIDLKFVAGVRNEIEKLLSRAENLDRFDPKVEAFIRVLNDKSQMINNKSLVFTTFRHTLAYLAEYVTAAGLRFGLVHGGVRDDERAALRHRFSLHKDDPQALDILLSSEVGCEGLDFQFCDLLINYDLPWNPMRVEQRIGRIDRYGQQSETVAIVNMVTPGTVDADIYERCLLRIGVFQHAVGGSEEILGEITQEIHDIAESFTLSEQEREERLKQLGDNSIRQVQEEQLLEEKQAELFGLTVPVQSWQEEIEAAETFWLSPKALLACVKAYLSSRAQTDGEFLLGEKPLKTLRLNHEIRARLLEDFKQLPRSSDPLYRQWEKWLKGADPMLSVTVDQETAAANSDVVHLGVLHPLVRQAALHQEHSDVVKVSLHANSETISPGRYPFALYHWRKVGVKNDDELVAVANDDIVQSSLLSLLIDAHDAESVESIDDGMEAELDQSHHIKWRAARASHVGENHELVKHRQQSLSVSHQARRNLLEEQLRQATNQRITRMKESELGRAIHDYERRMRELEDASNSADIHANPLVVGVLTVTKGLQE
tara:strand:+ start:15438 stop:19037 length:3600 start_codon:yes stop_codon:yes gene_type:complete